MSAAVVPGAKFDARTVKGPALPFMLKPDALPGFAALVLKGFVMLEAFGEERAEATRSVREELERELEGRCAEKEDVEDDR